MSQPGSALLASDPLQLGMLLLPQSLAWAEPSALTLDMSRVGVTLLVPDPLQLDVLLLMHSPSQLDLVLSVPDFVNPGSMLLVRSGIIGDLTGEITFNNLVGTSLSVSSLSYVGLTLPVFALAQVGFLLVARSFTCLGPASLALDSLQLSAPLSPRSLA